MGPIASLFAFIPYKMYFTVQYYSGKSYIPNKTSPLIIVLNNNIIACGIEDML